MRVPLAAQMIHLLRKACEGTGFYKHPFLPSVSPASHGFSRWASQGNQIQSPLPEIRGFLWRPQWGPEVTVIVKCPQTLWRAVGWRSRKENVIADWCSVYPLWVSWDHVDFRPFHNLKCVTIYIAPPRAFLPWVHLTGTISWEDFERI